MVYRPANADSLTFDGNTAHSTAWWWLDAGAFYIGGALYYDQNDKLVYDPGTSMEARRTTCQVNNCLVFNSCTKCDDNVTTALKMTNSKAFLAAGMALVSFFYSRKRSEGDFALKQTRRKRVCEIFSNKIFLKFFLTR